MIPIFSLLLILYISLFITKIATIFLMHTGLSKQEANFRRVPHSADAVILPQNRKKWFDIPFDVKF